MRPTKRMMAMLALLTAPIGGALLVGCDGSSQDDAAGGPSSGGVQASVASLATVDVGYGTIEFQQLTSPDGSVNLALSELAPGTLKTTPLDALLRGQRLTTMETFRAIAPDRTVPAAIASSHAAEAAALGRTNASIVAAAFDRNAPVEKSIASCESWVLQDTGLFSDWTKIQKANSVSGDKWLAVGNSAADWAFPTTARVTLGVCNESNVAITGRLAWDTEADAIGWIYGGFATLNPGIRWRWYNFTKSTPNCTGVPAGGLCVAQYAVRYGVNGVSAAGKLYHQRTAVEGPQACTTSANCPSFYRCSSNICIPEPH